MLGVHYHRRVWQVILEIIRKSCRSFPQLKGRFLRTLIELLQVTPDAQCMVTPDAQCMVTTDAQCMVTPDACQCIVMPAHVSTRHIPWQLSFASPLILSAPSCLQGASPGVAYEAAGTLLSLSSAGSAVKAATACYCQLLSQQSDNNVKLIILDRLDEVKKRHPSVLQGLVMDMLQVATPGLSQGSDAMQPREGAGAACERMGCVHDHLYCRRCA